ncbi:MAG: hypothetical protein U0W40_07870 [Acidimicrobiia bacterium]
MNIGSAAAEVERADAVQQTVDRPHAQLLRRELHHEAHDPVGAGVGDAGLRPLRR